MGTMKLEGNNEDDFLNNMDETLALLNGEVSRMSKTIDEITEWILYTISDELELKRIKFYKIIDDVDYDIISGLNYRFEYLMNRIFENVKSKILYKIYIGQNLCRDEIKQYLESWLYKRRIYIAKYAFKDVVSDFSNFQSSMFLKDYMYNILINKGKFIEDPYIISNELNLDCEKLYDFNDSYLMNKIKRLEDVVKKINEISNDEIKSIIYGNIERYEIENVEYELRDGKERYKKMYKLIKIKTNDNREYKLKINNENVLFSDDLGEYFVNKTPVIKLCGINFIVSHFYITNGYYIVDYIYNLMERIGEMVVQIFSENNRLKTEKICQNDVIFGRIILTFYLDCIISSGDFIKLYTINEKLEDLYNLLYERYNKFVETKNILYKENWKKIREKINYIIKNINNDVENVLRE